MSESACSQELTSERLLSVSCEPTGKSNAATFVVRFARKNASVLVEHRDVFWADVHNAVKRVPTKEHVFVLMDVKAYTARGCYDTAGINDEIDKVWDGRDEAKTWVRA